MRPEPMAQDEKISVVPPEFPQNGHSVAITGIPVHPYCKFRTYTPGRQSVSYVYVHTSHILSETNKKQKLPITVFLLYII